MVTLTPQATVALEASWLAVVSSRPQAATLVACFAADWTGGIARMGIDSPRNGAMGDIRGACATAICAPPCAGVSRPSWAWTGAGGDLTCETRVLVLMRCEQRNGQDPDRPVRRVARICVKPPAKSGTAMHVPALPRESQAHGLILCLCRCHETGKKKTTSSSRTVRTAQTPWPPPEPSTHGTTDGSSAPPSKPRSSIAYP